MRRTLLVLTLLSAWACERTAEPPLVEAQVLAATAPVTAPARATVPSPKQRSRDYVLPAAPRVVAIGDLHGDIAATRQVLELAGALDASGHWAGGKLVVVQTGDQFDRGDGEREILDLLEQLTIEAKKAGGALHVLNGNHEIMNAQGDFRYVMPEAMHAFDDIKPQAPGYSRFPSHQRGRAAAFLPGGGIALRLAPRPIVLQVGDTVFAHAGVRAPHVDFGIDRLNSESTAWLRGELEQEPRLLGDMEGPTWTRIYGSPELDAGACQVLDAALTRLGAKRMVVGHSVQPGGVAAGCGGKVQRIDVGLSSHYGTGPLQALEIVGEAVKVLSQARK